MTEVSMFYKTALTLVKGPMYLYSRVEGRGLEQVVPDKRLVICANHTCWFDPAWIAAFFSRQIYFMGKSELFTNKALAYVLKQLGVFPVKRGKPDRRSIRHAIDLLKHEKVLGVFPEGTRFHEGQQTAFNGASYLALKTNSPVLPVTIESDLKFRGSVIVHFRKPIFFEENQIISADVLKDATNQIMQAIYASPC